MAPLNKIFISYSRLDKEFAQRINSDLALLEHDVWIDVEDLKGGRTWDIEVENALNASDCILALLSKNSITSKNVMDEIYYGIDENKKIIPVIIDNCKIPFRIRRFQHVDFSKDYSSGMAQLKAALELDNTGNHVNQIQNDQGQQPIHFINKYKYLLITLATLILILISWRLLVNPEQQPINTTSAPIIFKEDSTAAKIQATIAERVIPEEPKPEIDLDTQAWKLTAAKESLGFYKAYQTNFPKGKYYAIAQEAIVRLTSDQNIKQDEMNWKNAINVNTTAGYEKYIGPGYNGNHLSEARQRIKQLEADASDGTAWAIAVTNGTKAALQQYINIYPNGIYINEAKDKLKTFSIYTIGQKYRGGIIFFIDSTGEHGLIGAKENISDSANDHRILKSITHYKPEGFSHWRVPNKEELNMLYKNRSFFEGLSSEYYWSSTPEGTTNKFFVQHFLDGTVNSFNGKDFKYPVRPISNF